MKNTLLLIVLLLVACDSSVSGSDAMQSTDGTPIDASVDASIDADLGCRVAEVLDGETLATQLGSKPDPGIYTWQGSLTSDLSDVVFVELYDTLGMFAGTPLATGTYNITGTALDYSTCGLCVLLRADNGDKNFFATSGSITITAFSGTTISGSLNNVAFEEVTLTQNDSTPVPGGCTLQWNETVNFSVDY